MEKAKSEREHQQATIAYKELEKRASDLEKKLKRNINKARYETFKVFRFLFLSCLAIDMYFGEGGEFFVYIVPAFSQWGSSSKNYHFHFIIIF